MTSSLSVHRDTVAPDVVVASPQRITLGRDGTPLLVVAPPFAEPTGALTDEQLAQRRYGLGASEVAAILGLDKYRSGFDVWLGKRGLVERGPETSAQRWGQLLEAPIADVYVQDLQSAGIAAWGRPVGTLARSDAPWARATPDRIIETVEGDAWLLEVKTRSLWQASEFGEPGTDRVPDSIAIQAHWQMIVTGLDRCDVPVLIGGQDYRVFTLLRDAELHASLFDQVAAWWERHMVGGVEPPVAGESGAQWVKTRFPKVARDLVLEADFETASAIERLAEVREQIAELDQEKGDLETRVKLAIGDAKGVTAHGHRAVWSEVKGGSAVDWEAVARAAGASSELIRDHTVLSPGHRQFRFTAAKAE